MRVYIIYRRNRGKIEYWSRDTARNFWWRLSPEWVKFFTIREEAEAELQNVLSNNVRLDTHYGITTEYWTVDKVNKYKQPPYDPTE